MESVGQRQRADTTRYKMRVMMVVFADIITTFIAYFFALWLRFDFYFSKIPLNYLQHLLILIPIICATTLIIYRVCHLYQSIWRYASISEAYHIIIAYLILAGALLAEHAISWLVGVEIPRSAAIMGYIISLLFCVTIRFGYRMSRYMAVKRKTE